MSKPKLILPAETKIPDHIAIIPDGNRRWARARGKPTLFGHKSGFDQAPELIKASREIGVHTMTLWAFSTENWNRSPEEVSYLMKMYEKMIEKNLADAHKYQSRIVHLGRKDRIPKTLLNKIIKAETETSLYHKHCLNIALDYGGHDEINRAIAKLLADQPNDSWQETVGKYSGEYPIYGFSQYLDTAGQPYPFPDFLIRTSGEHRTSGLLTWQTAYTEYYFLSSHFPDFTPELLRDAILEFSRRRRRFGGSDKGTHLTFNPKHVGNAEAEAWQAYHQGNLSKAQDQFANATRELYGLHNGLADEVVTHHLKALQSHAQGDFKLASQLLNQHFAAIKSISGFAFDPQRLVELELNLWQTTGTNSKIDQSILEFQINQLMSEQFRINQLQSSKPARLRWLAISERKLAQQQNNSHEAQQHWNLSREYLIRSYDALKEMVA